MKVFFDTGAFIALSVEKEAFHKEVTAKYREYRQARALFLISDYILDELFTRLLYDFGQHTAVQKVRTIKRSIDQGEMKVLSVDDTIFQKALDVFLKYSDHRISFTDATTYALCKEFSIDEVCTLDSDFKTMRLPTSF